MNVSELKRTIDAIAEDIGCDGGTRSGSHSIPSSVSFYINDDYDNEYELDYIETDRLGGCGCAVGITFRLKRV